MLERVNTNVKDIQKKKTKGEKIMTVIAKSYLLEAGAHFGHQAKRWNPKMKEFIFTTSQVMQPFHSTGTAAQTQEQKIIKKASSTTTQFNS